MRNYDELLKSGNAAQLEKLKENEHKDGFDDIELDYAFNRMLDEYNELYELLIKNTEEWVENPDLQAVRREAADIANFAHMIILKCDKELKK